MSSVPAYHEFKPLDWQYRVIYDVEKSYDYSVGPQMVLLSGTVGSAKSVLGAWLGCHHAVTNPQHQHSFRSANFARPKKNLV